MTGAQRDGKGLRDNHISGVSDEDRQAGMRQVQTNAEVEAIYRAGEGLIFNDFPSKRSAAQDKVLHLAICSWVRRMPGRADPADAPTVPKIFFGTADEAEAWLAQHRDPVGHGWKYCEACLPGRLGNGELTMGQQPSASATVPSVVDDLFREPEVEQILYAHLREVGYQVRERIRVPRGGIVDAVATRDDTRIVIEVKGEDAGGYTSAQMNFQIAIGQISSRMTDPTATYAIAFPMTSDYRRVLRTFRGSRAFELLNLVLYAVWRDGRVLMTSAHDAMEWIESLLLQP